MLSLLPLLDDDFLHHFGLGKFGQVEHGGKDENGNDVHPYPFPWIRALNGIVVLDGFGDGQIALQGQHHRHKYRGEDGDALELIAKVGESIHVPITKWTNVFPRVNKQRFGRLRHGLVVYLCSTTGKGL